MSLVWRPVDRARTQADNAPVRPRLALPLLLFATLASADSAELRRLACPEAFAHSCLRRLYRCFDGAGACTRDITRFFSEGTVTDCWQNGARAMLTGLRANGSGTSTVTSSQGTVCLSGTTSTDPDLTTTVLYRHRHRRYWIARSLNGSWTVRCPGGRMESYDLADLAAGGCGAVAECSFGSCP